MIFSWWSCFQAKKLNNSAFSHITFRNHACTSVTNISNVHQMLFFFAKVSHSTDEGKHIYYIFSHWSRPTITPLCTSLSPSWVSPKGKSDISLYIAIYIAPSIWIVYSWPLAGMREWVDGGKDFCWRALGSQLRIASSHLSTKPCISPWVALARIESVVLDSRCGNGFHQFTCDIMLNDLE